MDDLRIHDHFAIPGAALSWTAARASGPGGQHVNKTATKVVLVLDLGRAGLPAGVLARLRRRAPALFIGGGRLQVISGDSRSQSSNLDTAQRRLVEHLRAVWTPPRKRRPTRPTRGSVKRRLDSKRRHAGKKAQRGRVRGEE